MTWVPLDSNYLHGVSRGYCIYYRKENENNVSDVNISDVTYTIDGLQPYRKYIIQLAAKTTPGCGVKRDLIIYTKEDSKWIVRIVRR